MMVVGHYSFFYSVFLYVYHILSFANVSVLLPAHELKTCYHDYHFSLYVTNFTKKSTVFYVLNKNIVLTLHSNLIFGGRRGCFLGKKYQ